MANYTINKMKYGDNTYNIETIHTVKGTQTTNTASWTGNIDIPTLYDGLTIAYYLPRTSAANATLNLTLADNTTTGAIPIYRIGQTRVGSEYPAGSTIILTYWGAGSISVAGNATTAARWTSGDYTTGNTNDTSQGYIRFAYGTFKPTTALYRYMVCLTKNEEEVIPINAVSNSTATTKTLTTDTFNPFAPIYYYSTTTTVNAGAAISINYFWSAYSNVNLSYSFNTGTTLTANKDVYIKATLTDGIKAKLATDNPIVQQLPTSDDGFIYIRLGHAVSTSNVAITYDHPIYVYRLGAIRTLSGYAEESAPQRLHNLYNKGVGATGRPATANIKNDGYGGMKKFLATSTMTEGKPDHDGHIINLDWDNGTTWNSQVFVSDLDGQMSVRSNHSTKGWTDWAHVYDENHKPTPAEIGAVAKTGDTMSGELVNSTGTKNNYAGRDNFIVYPDCVFNSDSSSLTGFLKITLPAGLRKAMVRFTVSVFEYVNTGNAYDYVISGYMQDNAAANWSQASAYSHGSYPPPTNDNANGDVIFGRQGSGTHVISIGSANSVWKYPKVIIHDILFGYGTVSTFDKYKTGWSIEISPTAISNIDKTIVKPNALTGFFGPSVSMLRDWVDPVIATYTDITNGTGATCDKSFDQLYAALGDGRPVYAKMGNNTISVNHWTTAYIVFISYYPNTRAIKYIFHMKNDSVSTGLDAFDE